ncbi:MAG: CotH kinase family protein [Oscillospiraceae bacterium]|nr:CotH kinase family protein [Oscillospiraceae bacterium]
MKKHLCLLLIFALLLGGCAVLNEPEATTTAPTDTSTPAGSSEPTTAPTGSQPSSPAPTETTGPLLPEDTDGVIDIGVDRLPCPEEEIYEQLFNPDSRIEIDIQMSDAELQKLQADYEHYRDFGSKSPIYRMADVTITINGTPYRIQEVGVRMKGNTSRTSFYKEEEGGIYKAIHLKLDFQETFEEPEYYGDEARVWTDKAARKARKNRTFAALEKLEMRWNKCYDSTYLKETYAYELYRSEGVLAPLTNLCSFDWSGVHMGVYTLNEPVDELFLEKRLPAAELEGDLYKCGWTWEGCSFTNMNSIGIENEDKGEFFCYDLKTNKKTSDHSALKNLLRELNSGAMTEEKFASLVDVENFISYAAVSYFLGNPDDLRNNYNNFYLYFMKSSGKAIIIPYDYDRCLGVTVEYNPSGHGMTSDNPFSDIREGAQNKGDKQENPLFLYTVVKGGYYVAEYADALTRVSENDLLKIDTFKNWFDRAAGLYGNDVQPSKILKNMDGRNLKFDLYRTSSFDSQGNISFDEYITAKMSYFRAYMAKVDEYINYQRPQPSNFYIRGDFNGWSNHEEYGMTNEGGLMTYTLSFNHDFAFKVYNNVEQDWLGVECLPEDTTVEYTTNDHGNIKLKPGTYRVTYNPETMIITLEKL